MASSEVMTSSTHSFAYSYRLVKKCFVKSVITFLFFNRFSSGFHCYVWKNLLFLLKFKWNLFRISPLRRKPRRWQCRRCGRSERSPRCMPTWAGVRAAKFFIPPQFRTPVRTHLHTANQRPRVLICIQPIHRGWFNPRYILVRTTLLLSNARGVVVKGEVRSWYNLISEERVKISEQNSENLMKIGWKIRKLWHFEISQIFRKHLLTSQYEYANEWVDDVIASQFSIHFVHRNDKKFIFQLW